MRYEDRSTWRVSNRAALLNVPCAISDLRQRGIATCRSSPQIKMADFDQETSWNGKRPRHQSNREQSRKSFRPALRWISVRGLGIGRYSGARTHLCGEVGTGRQRGVIFGGRLSRRVRALSAPWRCLDLLGSHWRAYDWRNSLGGLARSISAHRLNRVPRETRAARWRAVTALVFADDRGSQVPIRLTPEEAGFELLVPQSIQLGGVNAGRQGGAYPSCFVFDAHLA